MYKRILENKLKQYLSMFSCVLIYGPKFSGKTFLAKNNSNSYFYVAENGKKNYELFEMNQEYKIFEGENPRLIDEWQIIPEIWDKIRHISDQSNNKKGLYIITGSSILYNKDRIFHSGAGRISRIKLLNLTYCEKNCCKISFFNILKNNKLENNLNSKKNNDEIIDLLISGGWPALEQNEKTNNFTKEYIQSILSMNVKENINLNYKRNIAEEILKSISRLNTTQIKKSRILNDINNLIDIKTLDKYLEVFEDIFLTFKIYHWDANFRSKYKIISSPKVYLSEPSIGLTLLGINSKETLLTDLNTFGLYFENLVIKDLIVFCENYSANLYFYRDEKGNEIDVIIHMPNGKWFPIEIKLAISYEDAKKCFEKMDYIISLVSSKQKNISSKPLFKIIITSSGYSYKINNDYVLKFSDLSLF